MKTILDILIQISKSTGSGSKGVKLKTLKESVSKELKYILNIAFNPFINTNLKVVKKGLEYPGFKLTFEAFKEAMDELISHKAANDDLRNMISDIVWGDESLSKEQRDMLVKIVTKNLNIGIGVKLINKAFGDNFLPDNKMMKADDKMSIIEKWFEDGEEVFAETKMDGVRIWVEILNNKIKGFFTYEGRPIDITRMSNIVKALSSIDFKIKHAFIDGELTGTDRQSVSGLVTKIIEGTAPVDIDKAFVFNIFDYDTYKTIGDGSGVFKYIQRRSLLEKFQIKSKQIKIVERIQTFSMKEIDDLFEKKISEGEEGLIVKKGSHVYEIKRSKNWVKMKEVKECDLKIVGWYSGKGGSKREVTIGGFNCESSDGVIKVEVGSGLSDELLRKIAKNPDSYIGRIVAVKYNYRIKNKKGQQSLYLPRLSEIRIDKSKANSSKEIE
jgi:ATP-dependent DNA ligase